MLMWGMTRHRIFILAIAAATIAADTAMLSTAETHSGGSAANGAAAGDQVLAAAAAKLRVPAGRLYVADRFRIELALTDRTLEVAKAVDMATSRVVAVAVDHNGRTVDFDAARQMEAAALRARDGKLDRTLTERLAKARPTEKIPVSVWIRIPDLSTRALPRASQDRRLDAVESAVAPSVEKVAKAIKDMGSPVTTPRAAPAVFAELNRGQINKLQRRSDVVAIYGPQDYRTHGDDAATTLRTHKVWPFNKGVGTRIAVNEPGGVSDTNPFLNNATHPVVFYCSSASVRCVHGKNLQFRGGHASRVAGQIASTHPQFRGIAPETALILSENAGFADADVVDANEWGLGNGADVTNMSWGTTCGGFQDFKSRYVDWAVKHLRQTFVISAGNNDCGTNEKVVAPGVAWSVITVGATHDSNDGFWANDTITTFSSHGNPDFAPGMEKPEVVAVGGILNQGFLICSTGLTGADLPCDFGTSLAAPQVAGIVALLIARRPGQDMWPETNKAAILASAFHDITPGTSRDGVGEPVAYLADDTYSSGRFFNDQMEKGRTANLDHQVPLVAGQRVRVAISWDSISDKTGTDTLLGEDIDLHVLGPDGKLACVGISVDNAWESCEFTAPVTGTYTLRESPYSSPLAESTYIGMAYSIWYGFPNSFCSGALFPSGGGTYTVDTSNGPTYFDKYPGWNFDQSGREFVWQYNNPGTRTLTFTDTNQDIDLHAMRISDCGADPISPTMLASGSNTLTLTNAPPGTYYFVADGRNGTVDDMHDTFTLSVN
jgi:Subtilase family